MQDVCRYDGRGHLYDLRQYDSDLSKGKYDELSEEEKRVEALIDEERYLELHTDIAERAMYEGKGPFTLTDCESERESFL